MRCFRGREYRERKSGSSGPLGPDAFQQAVGAPQQASSIWTGSCCERIPPIEVERQPGKRPVLVPSAERHAGSHTGGERSEPVGTIDRLKPVIIGSIKGGKPLAPPRWHSIVLESGLDSHGRFDRAVRAGRFSCTPRGCSPNRGLWWPRKPLRTRLYLPGKAAHSAPGRVTNPS